MTKPALIIHGGFFTELTTNHETKIAKQNALKSVVQKSYEFLQTHSALETVVYATSLLEDDELFNAGTGSQIQSDGIIRMSAALMDGKSQKFSGVMNIKNVKNPIQVAEKLLDEEDRVLADEGANLFAFEHDFKFHNPQTEIRYREYLEKKSSLISTGTVGCVALDSNGNLAAATSTGGKGFELVGRVSDSATVAGTFCTDIAGVSCTGVGEDIINGAIAAKIVIRVTDGMSLKDSVVKTFDELKKFDGFAGVVCLDVYGNIYFADSHPYMVYAYQNHEKLEVFK